MPENIVIRKKNNVTKHYTKCCQTQQNVEPGTKRRTLNLKQNNILRSIN